MNELTALQSASLADDVYALTRFINQNDAVSFLKQKYGDVLSIKSTDIVKGKTGGPGIIKSRTAFGFTLLGKNKFNGQAFIIFRGTQYLADWLTNLNIGVSRSNFGQPVHDGFNKTFKTMQPKLKSFLDSLGPEVSTVHCIGHSLGGALATICGEWLQSSTKYKPYIYTFGSPRVGLHGFADICTKRIGSTKIFRAYHKTDIVPCIPFWPYIHTPNAGQDYYLPSPGIVPMAEYHGMDHYIDSVRGKSWGNLASLKSERKNDAGIEQWLKQNTPFGLTITTIEWLNQALIYVLKKCLDIGARLISATFSTTFTLMDQIAYILKKGIDLSKAISEWVVYLIRKIMHLLGMKKVVEKADLTFEFIQGIFIRLSRQINEYVQRVLSNVLVNGRAT